MDISNIDDLAPPFASPSYFKTLTQEIGYIMYAIGIQRIPLQSWWADGGTDSYTAYNAAVQIRKEHGAFTYEKDGESFLEEDMVHAAVTQFFNDHESIDEAVRRHEEANPDEQSMKIDGDGYLLNP